jgi:hypothetical protein
MKVSGSEFMLMRVNKEEDWEQCYSKKMNRVDGAQLLIGLIN